LAGNTYRCVCLNGFTGDYCQTALAQTNGMINHSQIFFISNYFQVCKPTPCKNGASCFPVNNNDYVCGCAPQYTGKQCQTILCMFFAFD